jgi:hypothetical protein
LNDNRTGVLTAGVGSLRHRREQPQGRAHGDYFVDNRESFTNDQQLVFRVNNGVPNQLTEAVPFVQLARAQIMAFYAQDQWTHGRLTLQGAVRYDRAHGWCPAQQIGPTRFFPTPVNYPETQGVDSYVDVTRRIGAAMDGFGNGKTALKFSMGKYLEGASTGNPLPHNTNPVLRLPNTNPPFGPLGVSAPGRCQQQFPSRLQPAEPEPAGSARQRGRLVRTDHEPRLRHGHADELLRSRSHVGIRRAAVGLGAERVGAAAAHEARVDRELEVLQRDGPQVDRHRAVAVLDIQYTKSTDYTPYSITAPLDPRLPNGGGYTIPGLYDIVPTLSGQINSLTTLAEKYGTETQTFNGVDITLSVRATNGLTFQGGTSTGHNQADACDVRSRLPELNAVIGAGLVGSTVSTVSPYCKVDYGWLTQVRGLATTRFRVDVQVSGVVQSKPVRSWPPTTRCRRPSSRSPSAVRPPAM